ncbi:hypothetical protein GCM10025857_14290 [Alicyclobacillus contaminans]|nr:hypothetical protein GCM10025857_14290 [Alicyclobacillus contaminans]
MRGRISIAGKDVAKLEPLERVRRIGFVGQNPDAEAVYHRVDREVAFALENVGVPPEDMSWRVAEVLEMVGMSDYVHAEIRQLSGGQRQRVALAAALVHQPEVLVLDEPTAQLDPVAAAEWFQLLRRLNQEFGLTIVMSEHRIDPAYAEVDHVWYLERGRLRFAGMPRLRRRGCASTGPRPRRRSRACCWMMRGRC